MAHKVLQKLCVESLLCCFVNFACLSSSRSLELCGIDNNIVLSHIPSTLSRSGGGHPATFSVTVASLVSWPLSHTRAHESHSRSFAVSGMPFMF